MFNLRTRICASSLLVLFLVPILCFAQFEAATVLGTLRDSSGAILQDAKVTLENVQTGVVITATSNAQGDYQFVNVRLGQYRVKAEVSGFQTAVSDEFALSVNARQRVDLTLNPGQTTETVNVSGTVSLLEAETSARGQVITPREIVNLPLNGRAYADLALLVPGVRKSLLNNQSTNSRDASFNVNGLRSSLNNFTLDGVDNNSYGTSNQGFSNQVIQPSPDALQEFKVETNNYSAEFGRAGGAVINATIKSGTNQLHGAVWEFMRNTDLNAVGFFQPPGGVKPTLIQNQFGAALGGPIKKDKIFLFGDYEGFRRITRSRQVATIPTLDQRAGKLGIPVKNPLTGVMYANGIIPESDITPFARAVLNDLPAPNLPGNSNNFVSLPRGTQYDDKGDIRYDQYFNDRLAGFVRYSQRSYRIFEGASVPPPSGGNANGDVHVKNWQVVPGVTWTMSPTSVLEARVGIDYTEAGKTPIGLGLPTDQYQIPNLPSDPRFTGGLYTLSFSGGLSQLGRQPSNPQFQNPFVINPKVNYSKIVSRHTLKMGYEFQSINTEIDDFNPKYGQDNYQGLFSNPTGSTRGLTSAQQQAYSLADFMFGARNQYQLNNAAIVNYRQRMHFLYLQDDFKVNSRLTLNLGLRYEFATPQWERDNKLVNFDPVTQQLIQAKGGSIYDRALIHPDRNNFAPRIGLAYRLSNKTVIRSGYGISYIHFNRLGGENLLAFNGPNIVNAQINQLPSQGVCGPNSAPSTCFRPTWMGFPENFAVPENFSPTRSRVNYIPADYRTSYVQTWHFTVQQELAKNFLLDIGYIGNRSVGLMILGDYNQARPNAPGENTPLQQRRPLPGYDFIQEAFGGGFATYNALQVKLEKRYTAGIYLLNSFTWSKGIDNASGHLETANGDNSRVNMANLASEKGPSSYDQTFNNVTTFIYDLPFGKGRRYNIDNTFANLALGGWQVNFINTMNSGMPINLTYSPSSQFQVSTAPNYRPNLTGVPVLMPEDQRGPNRYLNPAGVSIPSDITRPFGTAGRNIARSYALYQLDLGLHKDFPMWSESSHLEFRAEAFNLLNKTNFMAPNSNASSSTYGTITSTFPARQLQFALKLVF